MEDLELDDRGNIALCPVMGWTPATPGGVIGMLRFKFVRSEEKLQRGEVEAVQLAMTEPQLAALQQDLQKMLAILRQPGTSVKQ